MLEVVMSGIQYLTDEKGHKTAAVIDLKVHKALWEDIQDLLVSKARRHERVFRSISSKLA